MVRHQLKSRTGDSCPVAIYDSWTMEQKDILSPFVHKKLRKYSFDCKDTHVAESKTDDYRKTFKGFL